MRTPTRSLPPVAVALLLAVVLAVAAVAVLHGFAAVGHQAEAADHAEMARSITAVEVARNPGVFDEMADAARVEARIGRMLWWSTAVGLLLAFVGVAAWRRPRFLAGWATAALAANLLMLGCGIASRSSVGLFGHTDPVSRLWVAAVALEGVAALAAVGLLAAAAAVRQLDRTLVGDLGVLVAPTVGGR